MSHTVSTAQKYYNIEDQERSDIRVASFLSSLVKGKKTEETHGEKPKEDDEREHKGGEDQEPGIDFGISFVQEDQIETLVIGNNNDVGSDTADHTFKLEQHEKKEITKLFQDLLKVGCMPGKHIYNQRKMTSKTLKRVRYENALSYMTKKSRMNLTSRDKCRSWLKSGEIHQVAPSTTSSCGTSRYWTDLQTAVVKEVMQHLPFNARISDILEMVLADEACQDHQISKIYTRQQIREKFKNIAKNKKPM